MSKYLLLWRLDPARIPIDRRDRGKGWGMLMTMIKTDREKGVLKDWGAFPSEGRGYGVAEGSPLEIMKMTEQYAPFVQFELHPVATINESEQLIAHLSD